MRWRRLGAVGVLVVDGKDVAVDLEVGDEGGVLSHDDLKGVGVGDDGVIHRPVSQMIAGGRRGDEVAGVREVVGSRSGDGAAHRRVGGGGDLEVVEDEVYHEGGVLCHDDLKGVGGGDDGVVDGPVEEEVGGVLGGDEGGGVAVGVGSRAGDGAALIGFRQGGYLVSVPVKEVVDGGSGLVVSNGDRVAIEGFVDALVVLGGGGAAVGTGIDLAAVVTLGIGVEEVGVIDTELVLSLEGDGGVGDAGFAILIEDMSVHVAPAGDLDGDGVGRSGLARVIHGGDIIKVSAHVVGQGAVVVARIGRAVDQNPVTIDVVVSE